jgi:hypothetical protein
MLSSLYYPVDIYRKTTATDSWNNETKTAVPVYSHTEQGFLQPRSGTYSQQNQRNNPLSTHVFYTSIGVDIKEGDNIKTGGKSYRVDFVQGLGIGGISDHQEIDVSYLDDLS